MLITDQRRDQILALWKLEEVVMQFIPGLKAKGKRLIGDCPRCNAKGKLDLHTTKQVLMCWSHMQEGDGIGSPVKFLMDWEGMSFPEAMEWLAVNKGETLIGETAPAKRKKNDRPKSSFRDRQLTASGITQQAQRDLMNAGIDKWLEIDRYEKGTITPYWDVDPHGDDMILHYLDLAGNPMTYPGKNGKPKPFIRIRWENPELHADIKTGKPRKYVQPAKSGVHLWIPALVRKDYSEGVVQPTLYLDEGEKKADKKNMHGMFTVGLMGINNIASRDGENSYLPEELQRIVKRNQVQRVVMTYDSDWQELSNSIDEPVDNRPKNFFASARRFKEHFRAFQAQGIDLELFLAYLRPTAAGEKAVDDFLAGTLKGREHLLAEDYERALLDTNGQGEYVRLYKITAWSDFQLQKLWGLESPVSFFELHGESLRKRTVRTFSFRGKKWRYNPDKEGVAAFELENQLMPEEQYWKTVTKRRGEEEWEELKFEYQNMRRFLRNRGFFRVRESGGTFLYYHEDDRVMDEVTPHDIGDYVLSYTEDLSQMEVLSSLLLPGAASYLGSSFLSRIYTRELPRIRNANKSQYFFFQRNWMKVTDQDITTGPLETFEGSLHRKQLLPFDLSEAPLKRSLLELEYSKEHGQWLSSYTDDRLYESEFFSYLWNTSNQDWSNQSPTYNENGRRNLRELAPEESATIMQHFLSKLTAIGYLLHRHQNPEFTRIVLLMDSALSQVGASKGRTGKSMFSKAVRQLAPFFVIDGQEKNFEQDRFMLEGLTVDHGVIYVDDAYQGMPLTFWYAKQTEGYMVKRKGTTRVEISPEEGQKTLISTNHSFTDMFDDSSRDRMLMLGFSNWYSADYKPSRDFTGMLFTNEWPHEQWVMALQLMITGVHLYLKHGFIDVPNENLKLRSLRQEMGEEFLSWFDLYVSEYLVSGSVHNPELGRIEKYFAYDTFLDKHPGQRRWTNITKFKAKIIAYARYKGLLLNPHKMPVVDGIGEDYKSSGKEYFLFVDPNRTENFYSNTQTTLKYDEPFS